MLKIEKFIFYALLLLSLSIVIWPQYYITGDGASHTYNAKVLFDYALNNGRDFYKEYYIINRHLDPNWSSHIIIGFFTLFCKPWLADKLFQILYILVFSFGFRYLIKSINKENAFLSLLFYPFLFTLPFQQGFYNNSLGLAFLFISLAYYIRNYKNIAQAWVSFVLSMLVLATALSHGMPAVYTMSIISALFLFWHWEKLKNLDIAFLKNEISRFALIFLPSILLIAMFMAKRGFGTTAHRWTYYQKFVAFLKMWGSQSTRHDEIYPAVFSLVIILVFLIFGIIKKAKEQKQKFTIVFLIFALVFFYQYITAPNTIGGAGSIDIRLVFLPPLFLIFYVAGSNWTLLFKNIYIIASVIVVLAFTIIRFPFVMQANEVAKEIMQGNTYIKNNAVVLNLHFDDWQIRAQGDSIFQKDNSFLHLSDYYGAEKNKHLIMLMNYEADINYFPVNWAAGKNPRQSINGMYAGTYPPLGNYKNYELQSGKKIDYILFQNWRNAFALLPQVQSMIQDMQADNFKIVFSSKNKYIQVWARE